MGIGGISMWQLLILLLIVVLVFGTKRLRNMGSDLGAAVKGFRKGMDDVKEETLEPDQIIRSARAKPPAKNPPRTRNPRPELSAADRRMARTPCLTSDSQNSCSCRWWACSCSAPSGCPRVAGRSAEWRARRAAAGSA